LAVFRLLRCWVVGIKTICSAWFSLSKYLVFVFLLISNYLYYEKVITVYTITVNTEMRRFFVPWKWLVSTIRFFPRTVHNIYVIVPILPITYFWVDTNSLWFILRYTIFGTIMHHHCDWVQRFVKHIIFMTTEYNILIYNKVTPLTITFAIRSVIS